VPTSDDSLRLMAALSRIGTDKSAFYEQVTDVNVVCPYQALLLFSTRADCCSPPCFYSHSRRAVLKLARCLLGLREESMLPFLARSLGPKPTRSHRNTVWSQRVNMIKA
jgi:hypothetical protein